MLRALTHLAVATLLAAGCAERNAPPAGPPAPAPLPWPATVDDLAWLTGDWVGDAGGACFVERWLPPASGSLVGVGRHASGGPAPSVTRETMRLMSGADGLVMMVILDGGQVTRFPLTAVGADGFLARRADDGWPRTMRYERRDAGLAVTLAGAPGERALTIPFTRLPPSQEPSCPGRVAP